MSKRTIAKISVFVILLAGVAVMISACGHASSSRERPLFDPALSPYGEPRIIGRLASPEVTESSGLAASKCQPNVFWTHNDSSDNAFIYAFDSSGKSLGTWRIAGAENRDWEDMAAFQDANGQCFLYIGEIGNNESKRDRTIVYRVREPVIGTDASSDRRAPLLTEPAEEIYVNYPSGRPNAETLLVHPKTGDIYIVTKRFDGPAAVYRIAPQFGIQQPIMAEKIADISVPSVPNGWLTGGDISPDGNRVVLCDYVAAYEFSIPKGAANLEEIWKQTPVKFDIGDRQVGESVAYGPDGSSLYSTSEGSRSPIFEMKRR